MKDGVAMSCCSTMGECTSMSKEECIEKGCTNKDCKFMMQNDTKEISKNVMVEKTKTDDGIV